VLRFFRKKSDCNDIKLNSELKNILGFKPKNYSLYYAALTHKSATNSNCIGGYKNNERLEFLGDAILDAVISELLYSRFPSADEGFLTEMRTKIVNGKKLAELSKKIGLNKIVKKNSGNSSSVRIYEDAFEALIGAMYLDKGIECTKKFIAQRIMIQHIDLNKLKSVELNHKSKLIEWSQKKKIIIDIDTDYESADSKVFISYIRLNNEVIGKGRAFSKKEAEQIASKVAFEYISNEKYTEQ
jgi:ribonuclease-3